MISSARAKQLLEYEFGNRSFTPEPVYYLGLSNTNPAESITEPPALSGYSRVVIENTSTNWGTVADGEYCLSNNAVFTFPVLISDTIDVAYWFLAATSTGTTPLYYGALPKTYSMLSDSCIMVEAGEMKIYRENSV